MSQTEQVAPEGPYHRLRCECCNCPTLDGDAESVGWPQSCVLCDWENAGPGDSAGVDDNVSLEQARANVARFNWMYDPDNLPDWLPARPSAEELQARATLQRAYVAIADDGRGLRQSELWEAAIEAESALGTIVAARVDADVSEAEAEADDEIDVADDDSDEDGADDDRDDSFDFRETEDGVPVDPLELAVGAALDPIEEESPPQIAPDAQPTALPASASPESTRSLGPFDYPGPPRGAAVIAGISSSNSDAIGAAVLRTLQNQRVMLYGSGYVGDQGAPHVIAILPTNAHADTAESVRAFLEQQPGVLGAFIDPRDGAQ